MVIGSPKKRNNLTADLNAAIQNLYVSYSSKKSRAIFDTQVDALVSACEDETGKIDELRRLIRSELTELMKTEDEHFNRLCALLRVALNLFDDFPLKNFVWRKIVPIRATNKTLFQKIALEEPVLILLFADRLLENRSTFGSNSLIKELWDSIDPISYQLAAAHPEVWCDFLENLLGSLNSEDKKYTIKSIWSTVCYPSAPSLPAIITIANNPILLNKLLYKFIETGISVVDVLSLIINSGHNALEQRLPDVVSELLSPSYIDSVFPKDIWDAIIESENKGNLLRVMVAKKPRVLLQLISSVLAGEEQDTNEAKRLATTILSELNFSDSSRENKKVFDIIASNNPELLSPFFSCLKTHGVSFKKADLERLGLLEHYMSTISHNNKVINPIVWETLDKLNGGLITNLLKKFADKPMVREAIEPTVLRHCLASVNDKPLVKGSSFIKKLTGLSKGQEGISCDQFFEIASKYIAPPTEPISRDYPVKKALVDRIMLEFYRPLESTQAYALSSSSSFDNATDTETASFANSSELSRTFSSDSFISGRS